MTTWNKVLPLLAVLSMAACAGAGTDRAQALPGAGVDPVPCGAAALAHLAGRPVTALPGDEVPGTIRIIRPGDAVTEDFSPVRLNVMLDASDHIASLTCG